MWIKKEPIDRRLFLKAAGTSLALPLLGAMRPTIGNAAGKDHDSTVGFCAVQRIVNFP